LERGRSALGAKSRAVALVAIFASLYAVTSLATAYLPTGPFFIQFRPAIAVPMVAAVISSPLIAGLSAAIGTFTASIVRYGTPIYTMFSGTPANFLGFYVMGYSYRVLRRRNVHWMKALIISSLIGLVVGSIIIALGLWFLAVTLLASGLEKFASLEFAIIASFLLVLAPAPIALILVIGILKVLRDQGKITL